MAIHAQAGPLVFTNTQYTTSAVAVADGQADYQTASSPPATLPALASAAVVGNNDFAASSGLGTAGLLTTTAEVDSAAGPAFATGQSQFIGSFTDSGWVSLHFDFLTLSSIFGDASAYGSVFVTITNTLGGATTTLFNDVFTDNVSFDFGSFIPLGGVTTLDLILVSDIGTSDAGQWGQNFAQVSFYGHVPEPSTWALTLLGLLAVVLLSRGGLVAGRGFRGMPKPGC
ncbi:PEP-CTERM sorting domain-containing protein [Variovorax sp. HJSM1_2]|uniref:PEP-CTERM sorting domain-containing protein n=1 Tax=Variovorax sp. HJSM1_2 TaxID=3366263 RepID=UPI003BDDD7D6